MVDMPCKDCKDRYLGCHGKCEKYLTLKKLNDEQRRKERMLKDIERDYWATTRVVRKRGR